MSQPFHNLCFHFYFGHVFSSHLGSIHWKVSIVLGVRKQGQWGRLLRSDCLATHLPSSKDRGYLHFGKKEKSSPSHESRGKNILLTTPQRNLPFSENSPWVAFLCPLPLCVLPSGWAPPSEGHPELLRAMSAFWHCRAAAPSGQHQGRAQNILISFMWTLLSHTTLSFCNFLSWKPATPRGCLGLLLLTLKLPVSSLNLLRGSWSQPRQGNRRAINFTEKLFAHLHEVGTKGRETVLYIIRETELGYIWKNHYSKLETSYKNISSSIFLSLHDEGKKDDPLISEVWRVVRLEPSLFYALKR